MHPWIVDESTFPRAVYRFVRPSDVWDIPFITLRGAADEGWSRGDEYAGPRMTGRVISRQTTTVTVYFPTSSTHTHAHAHTHTHTHTERERERSAQTSDSLPSLIKEATKRCIPSLVLTYGTFFAKAVF